MHSKTRISRRRPLGHLRFCAGSAPARIVEDESRIVVESDVTGSAPDDIDILLSERLLAIRASSSLAIGRGHRTLQQRFALPRGIDLGAVRAELRNSLLRVILPWSAESVTAR